MAPMKDSGSSATGDPRPRGRGASDFHRQWTMRGLGLLIAGWFFVGACGSTASDAQATPDGAASDAARPDIPVPKPAAFVLRNETAQTIYIQERGYWELVSQGTTLRTQNTCCRYECGRSRIVTVELTPGSSYAWTWDGLAWPAAAEGCSSAVVVPRGPTQVRVLYSTTRMEWADGESMVGPTTAAEQPFDHPPAATVIVTVH
jgi:hypothetical protein